MRWSHIPLAPTNRVLRQFAGMWLAVFGGLAAYESLWRGRLAWAATLGVLALVVGPLGLVRPRAIRLVFVGAMILAFPIGWVVSHVLLAVVFFGLFLPVALVFRLKGRDALRLKPQTGLETYWLPKTEPADVAQYYKQF
ncbi:MAG TPA: SxtJ family membrane protein [Isosphaeraceae bacterium]|jgi:hypothetical protein|nr:SxtJ family membrane protein [Isosphaeraceae bacterium]